MSRFDDDAFTPVVKGANGKYVPEQARETKKAGVPLPAEVTRAHSRLAILPTPNQSDLSEAGTYIESPWPVTDLPAVDPNLDWDTAVNETVALSELTGTNRYLKRAKVTEHIETINKAASPLKSYALVAELDGSMIIIDGHHRLMAAWLLGQETAPVWKVEL
jgi:hypothetical protein